MKLSRARLQGRVELCKIRGYFPSVPRKTIIQKHAEYQQEFGCVVDAAAAPLAVTLIPSLKFDDLIRVGRVPECSEWTTARQSFSRHPSVVEAGDFGLTRIFAAEQAKSLSNEQT